MFERNDVLFGETARRFNVKESVVESLVLGMLWAGERALGRDEVKRALLCCPSHAPTPPINLRN